MAQAHRAAVDDTLAYLQATALRTRTGSGGAAQVTTRGMLAAAFDHWDTRTGDPNLHTHVVIANKVQGPDGRWRSVDSRALHHAAVAVSELYDDLLADHLARRLPVRWGWRPRGERRTPGFEIQGLDDRLLSAFSTRSADIDDALRTAVADFTAAHARPPSRVETVRLRQQATLATRPAKTPHPLQDLLARWADRARRVTGRDPAAITADALRHRPGTVLRHDQVSPATVDRLGALVVDGLLERRSTWTVWNARAEAARATRGLRMASAGDRVALLDRVTAAALARSESLEPVDPVPVVEGFTRPDGTSVFSRPDEHRYTDPRLLAAEGRLLDAHATLGRTHGARAHRPPPRDHPAAPRPARRPAGAPRRGSGARRPRRPAPPGGRSTCSSARPAPARPPP